jgi:DNA-binding NtrC family response regulator
VGGEHDLRQVCQETSRKRVLLVDGEQTVRLTLPPLLAKHGFDVTSVSTLQDALSEIQTETFDILLTDLNLPEVNGGFTVIEEMRKAQPGCINFTLTSHPTDESVQRATDHGVAHYFIKPVAADGMIDTIKQRLVTRASRRAV